MKKKTLVFGASNRSIRYSNMVISKLVGFGYDAVAYGLRGGEVLGININTELKLYKDIDTVTLYLNSEKQKEFYNHIISLRPKRVIFNPGTENPEFYQLLKDNNIDFEVACTLTLLTTNQY